MKTRKNTSFSKRWSKLKKVITYGLLIGSGLALVAFTLTFWVIFRDVKVISGQATQEFEGNCVEALIAYVESDDHSFKEKHNAMWALGEIGDPRALPTLERLRTGKPCTKPCRSDQYICQCQLAKSIRFRKGGNVVAMPLQYCLGLKK
ncbi:MAG: hypothetical protein JSU70_10740 [Phycisphaerales bacterium]|nr:MAG: hypothetical protein JSU70_10740 [Phycisphaerales bacterium]